MIRSSFADCRLRLLPLLLALGACQPGGEVGNDNAAGTANAGSAPPQAAAAAVNEAEEPAATAAAQDQIAFKSDVLEFSYGWPAQAVRIAPLNAWLKGNGDSIFTKWQADAREAFADSQQDGWVWRTYSYEERFAVEADTPRMLVLVSEGYLYTGGAHGMPISTAIIWDRQRAKRLATAQLIDLPALKSAAEERFCEALDAQRAERRGEPVPPGRPGMFDECVDITKQLVVPVSTGGGALDTIRVMIGPYEAGPYAEGSYVIDLPMTNDLLPVVRPAYREAFTVN